MTDTTKKAEPATTTVQVPAASLVEPGSQAHIEASRTNAPDKSIKVAEGAARAKRTMEEGQIPGNRGRADDGVPSAEENAASNERHRLAGHGGVVSFEAIMDQNRIDSHERMARVHAANADPVARLGFDPAGTAVKYVNEGEKKLGETGPVEGSGGTSPASPSAPATTRTVTPQSTDAQAAANRERDDAAERERQRLAAEARARGEAV